MPCVSIENAVLTVLFASATAAHFLPLRSTNACIQTSFLVTAFRLTAWLTADIAPTISWLLNVLFLTYVPIEPSFTFPPDEYCKGVKPIQADAPFPY